MAQKIRPDLLRLGITLPWASKWLFSKKITPLLLEEDEVVRTFLHKHIAQAGIAAVTIERVGDSIRVTVRANRPGIIIGRGGKGIEQLIEGLKRKMKEFRKVKKVLSHFELRFNIEELRRQEISAQVLAQQIAWDIEKRVPFRMIMRRSLESLKQNREVRGAKIRLSGRLNGSEIARTEQLAFGQMPLQTLRAKIDYGQATSFNTYGTVGIKVWIYTGEVFEKEQR